MEQEEMSYYDKQMEKRNEFAGFTAKVFLKLILPIAAIVAIWIYTNWMIGALTLAAWVVFVFAISMAKAEAKADKLTEEIFEELLRLNKEKEENETI
jgi:type IV secretory pathway TrbD component